MNVSIFTGSVVVVNEASVSPGDDPGFSQLPAVPDASDEGEYAVADAYPDEVSAVVNVVGTTLAFDGLSTAARAAINTAATSESVI